jgi:hypothetical protein
MAKISQDASTVRLLRRSVGLIGVALPFVLTIGVSVLAGRFTLLGTLSSAYFTGMRDVFVGSLSAIGVFLICYRYTAPDEVATTIAGVLAIGVAMFHPPPDNPVPTTSTARLIGWIHLVSAAGLLLLMAFICLFLFTRNPVETPATMQKRVRHGIYYVTGTVILLSLAAAAYSARLPVATRDAYKPLFWFESLAVFAFGVAWLVKGETIFKDPS